MASCLSCASLKVTRPENRSMTRTGAQSHAAQHFEQNKIIDVDYCLTSDQVFEQCFPNFVVLPLEKGKKTVKKEGRQPLLDLCHTLFDGRISKDSSRVTCHKCGTGIAVYHGHSRKLEVVIDHASAHLGIDLFECRKCERAFGSKNAVSYHLRTFHSLRVFSVYYTDKSVDFLDEITASIKQCFSEGHGPLEQNACTIGLKNVSAVRSKTSGSKLAVERQLLCYQQVRKQAGDDGKIQCRLCPKRIKGKQRSGYQNKSILDHALVHLKKPLYRCKVCSNVQSCRRSMRSHLSSIHALPLSKNNECLADKFHSDILDMLQKCYGGEAKSI